MLFITVSGGFLTLLAALALLWYVFAGFGIVLGFLSGIYIVIKRSLAPYYKKVYDYFFPIMKTEKRK